MSAPIEKYQRPVAQRDDWETPGSVFDPLNAEFGFTLDVCATPENAKCARFFTPDDDGLVQDWGSNVCWMNPPYGRAIASWIRKAHLSSVQGATVVCLIPARTDSAWWHDYAMKGEVRLRRGRIRFVGAKWGAPFPCAVVVMRPAVTYTARAEWQDGSDRWEEVEYVSDLRVLTRGSWEPLEEWFGRVQRRVAGSRSSHD